MDNIIFLDECTSTNDYIKENLSQMQDFTVVTAKLQTNGRGRRGHIWLADEGMLPISALFINPVERETLTARIGLAVCNAIESAYPDIKAQIKWPNDIIINSKKVCGILCECSFIGEKSYVICGIGMNLSQDEDFFIRNELPNGASLKMLHKNNPERKAFTVLIAKNLREMALIPLSDYLEQFKNRVINIGKTIKLIQGDNQRIAKAIGIAPNGFLICEDENGQFEVSSGEVSVRGKNGYI